MRLRASSDACPEVSGWERNSKGQLGPRVADLGSVMDPTRLMDSAVDLNLKLMRWRALPDLNLEKISSMRCLLLGAGTLGCYAARTLMGWGIRAITFVDSGQVSYSNPARQPLFEFADAKEKRDKAIAAASALKRIYPGMQAEGVVLSIPMPGHSVSDEAKAAKDLETLEGLVDSHDAIFLLTDSRESRWLGTVLGRAKGKIVINAALGFDTYLVMRHGVESSRSEATTVGDGQTPGSDLGCYYCNDVVAPSDSLNDRTLDQQCTVTRPGVAGLAGALAGELLAQIVGHPLGPLAPASPDGKDDAGPLGPVPHQIRGFLGRNNSMSIVGKRFGECIGCSDAIVGAYREQGWTFVRQALEDPTYLEELTGLAELKRRTDEVEIEDWDERSTAESADDDF